MRKTLSKCVLLLLCTVLTRPSWAAEETLRLDTLQKPGEGNVAVTVFDVGQGSCALISCPNGKKILVDCGSHPKGKNLDNAESLFNEIVGTQALEAVILSHGDADHYNLVPKFLPDPAERVDKVMLGGELKKYTAGGFLEWWDNTRTNLPPKANPKTPIPSISCGTNAQDGLYLLAANVGLETRISNKNRDSVVVMLNVSNGKGQEFRMMLPGDSDKVAEKSILEKSGDLQIDVALAEHHGADSKSYNTEAWTKATAPSMVIYSAGENNTHGHPRCSIVERYGESTAKNTVGEHTLDCAEKKRFQRVNVGEDAQFNTANNGAVVLVYDGKSDQTQIYGCPANKLENCTNLGFLDTPRKRVAAVSSPSTKRPSSSRDDEAKTEEVKSTRKKPRAARSISESR